MDRATVKKNISVPRYGTKALGRFFLEYVKLGNFLGFITQVAQFVDDGQVKALEYFMKHPGEGESSDKYRERLERIPQEGAGAALRSHWNLVKQMMICRGADNYLCYISELLSTIYRHMPETLRSKENVRVDFVLKYETMDELISAIADKKVNDLSYQSMESLSTNIFEEHGLALFENEKIKTKVIEIIETRNLFVHGRGVVNERFLTRVPSCKIPLGESLLVPNSMEFDMVTNLANSAKSIDLRASKKFGIRRVNLGKITNHQ